MAQEVKFWPFIIWSNYKWEDSINVKNTDGTAFDLTGYTFEAQVRVDRDPTSALIKAITITHNDAGGVLSLVQDNSSQYITYEEGWVTILATAPGDTPKPWTVGPVVFELYPTVPA